MHFLTFALPCSSFFITYFLGLQSSPKELACTLLPQTLFSRKTMLKHMKHWCDYGHGELEVKGLWILGLRIWIGALSYWLWIMRWALAWVPGGKHWKPALINLSKKKNNAYKKNIRDNLRLRSGIWEGFWRNLVETEVKIVLENCWSSWNFTLWATIRRLPENYMWTRCRLLILNIKELK